MKDLERRLLENQLIVMGLKRLSDPELVPQMALLIRDHDFYQSLLNECPQEKRREMYDALRPYLSFEPLPLDTYINRLKERAGAIESHHQPIQVGKKQYQEVPQGLADGCVVDIRCHLCKRADSFFGKTPLTAVILARQDGWTQDRVLKKEVCPKCPSEYRGKRKKCPNCQSRHFAPACSVVSLAERDAELVGGPVQEKVN